MPDRPAPKHLLGEGSWPDDAVEVARIGSAYGVKGWFKVHPYAADPQALRAADHWHLKPPEVPRPGAPVPPSTLQVKVLRAQADALIAQAHGVADRARAEALKGARVFVARATFPAAAADEYYWVDLIGMAVFNRSGERLGEVAGLIDTGPHCVLRVAAPEVPERLIPFVAAYVDAVDGAARRIAVDWGLDY